LITLITPLGYSIIQVQKNKKVDLKKNKLDSKKQKNETSYRYIPALLQNKNISLFPSKV